MSQSRVSVPSQDAVIIVPGIMGSRLRDRSTGDVLWGLDAGWYASAWFRNKPWQRLAVTEDERAGRTDRVVADRLLDFGAFSPVLGGFEPYSALHARLNRYVADDAAVLDFPYDWRLSVEHNAALLAETVDRHITSWRSNPLAVAAARKRPNQSEPRVVIIAHSMGGLVSQAMCAIPGAADHVRAVLTLGTPFQGAAQAALVLGTGEDTPFPLPRRRLRRMAATLPGLHDLLPFYPAVTAGHDVRELTGGDVAELGGDPELWQESQARYTRRARVELPGHSVYVGGFQPTPTMLQLGGSEVVGLPWAVSWNDDGSVVRDPDTGQIVRDEDAHGDGTVPLASAMHRYRQRSTVAQQHGALAKVEEAISQSVTMVDHAGPPAFLGDTRLGIELPDLVAPTEQFTIALSGDQVESASCTLLDAADRPVDYPTVELRDGRWVATTTCPAPGVYHVHAESGGGSPVRQTLLAQDPAADQGDD